METLQIPNRLYFKISEVSEITGVRPYVLRYWETEFGILKPKKSKSNQRMYEKRDIHVVSLIKHLLYGQRYTIAGAREKIKELRKLGQLYTGKEVVEKGGETPQKKIKREEAMPLPPVREEIRALLSLFQEKDDGPAYDI